jgi:putative redox protein
MPFWRFVVLHEWRKEVILYLQNIPMSKETTAKAIIGDINYRVTITADGNSIVADEPVTSGGGNTGFSPSQLLVSSLGACTVITLRMYASRKQWNVGDISVELLMTTEKGNTQINRIVSYSNAISEEQQKRLLQIADNCPIHNILTEKITIATK